MAVALMLISFELCTIKMKFSQILVCCMTDISNMTVNYFQALLIVEIYHF